MSEIGTAAVRRPGDAISAIGANRKLLEDIVVVVQRQADLLDVVLALRPPGGLSRLLNGRKEQGNQDRDDGNHH